MWVFTFCFAVGLGLARAGGWFNGQSVSCDPHGFSPNYDDCGKFFRCANGKVYSFNCPGGLHFDASLNVCNWPQDAGCDDGSQSQSSMQPVTQPPPVWRPVETQPPAPVYNPPPAPPRNQPPVYPSAPQQPPIIIQPPQQPSSSSDGGFMKGFNLGREAGYDKGYSEGHDEGYSEGLQEGRDETGDQMGSDYDQMGMGNGQMGNGQMGNGQMGSGNGKGQKGNGKGQKGNGKGQKGGGDDYYYYEYYDYYDYSPWKAGPNKGFPSYGNMGMGHGPHIHIPWWMQQQQMLQQQQMQMQQQMQPPMMTVAKQGFPQKGFPQQRPPMMMPRPPMMMPAPQPQRPTKGGGGGGGLPMFNPVIIPFPMPPDFFANQPMTTTMAPPPPPIPEGGGPNIIIVSSLLPPFLPPPTQLGQPAPTSPCNDPILASLLNLTATSCGGVPPSLPVFPLGTPGQLPPTLPGLPGQPLPGLQPGFPLPGGLPGQPLPGGLPGQPLPGGLPGQPLPGGLPGQPLPGSLPGQQVPSIFPTQPVPGGIPFPIPLPGPIVPGQQPIPGGIPVPVPLPQPQPQLPVAGPRIVVLPNQGTPAGLNYGQFRRPTLQSALSSAPTKNCAVLPNGKQVKFEITANNQTSLPTEQCEAMSNLFKSYSTIMLERLGTTNQTEPCIFHVPEIKVLC